MAKSKQEKGRDSSSSRKRTASSWGIRSWDVKTSHKHIAAALVLFLIALFYFAPVNFSGAQLAGSDTIQSKAMAQSLWDHEAETGEIALWATNLFSGMPGYMISYPLQVWQPDSFFYAMRQLAWPTAQFLLFVLGIYVFVYVLTRRSLAGLVAAAAAGLTSYIPIILSVGHTSKFMAISWVPWLLVAFYYVLRRPGLLTSLVFAVILAFELRARHPQISYHAFWLVLIWWIVEGVSAIRRKQTGAFVKSSAWAAAGTVAAVLMVAHPYWVQFEFKQFTIRGSASSTGGLGWDYAMSWSQSPLEMITLVAADALGGGGGTYWGPKPFTEGAHYLGAVVLFLAVLGITKPRDRVARGISIGALVILFFAFGRHAAWLNRPMFEYVPLFGAFRAPEMWLHMFELSIAVLAGIGADRLVRRNRHRLSKVTTVSYAAVLGVVLFLVFAGPSILSFERDGEAASIAAQLARREGTAPNDPAVVRAVDQYLSDVRSHRVERFSDDASRTLLVFVVFGGVLFLTVRKRIPAEGFLLLTAVIITVDLWGVGKRYLPDESFVDGSLDAQIPTYLFDQYILDRIEEAGGPGHFRTLSLENSPVNWARPAYHYETPGGYNAAKLALYQDFLDSLLFDPRSGLPTDVGLDLTGTRYIINNRVLPGTRVAFADERSGWLVLERPDARPRAVLVGDVQVSEEPAASFDILRSAAFDAKEEAVVAEPLPRRIEPTDSLSTTQVTLRDYDPHRIVWEVETDAPRLLATSEVYYPAGWTAYVDGEEVPILRTNYAFRGVVVPGGTHTVRMIFKPESHKHAVIVSLVATIIVYLLLGYMIYRWWIRRPRNRSEPAPAA